MTGVLFPRKGLYLTVFISLFLFGFVGIITTRDAFEPLLRRYTNRMTINNQELFTNKNLAVSVYVDYPKEVIPGETFVITVRGSDYLNNLQPGTMIIQVKTNNHQFISDINPTMEQITFPQNSEWIIEPLNFEVSTINLDAPPKSFDLFVAEVVDLDHNQSQFEENISISVDTYVVPKTKIIQLIVSLLLTLFGVIGPFILKK